MADRTIVIPGAHFRGHFSAYPMAQVAMSRWGYHRAGTWNVEVFLPGLDFINRLAVMDDFGTLVEVAS